MSPSQDSRDIIEAAIRALDRVWISGHRYAKAGVMLNDFTPSGVAQLNLFDWSSTEREQQASDAGDWLYQSDRMGISGLPAEE